MLGLTRRRQTNKERERQTETDRETEAETERQRQSFDVRTDKAETDN